MTQPRTITFPYLLADGSWHRVALYLSGDSLALYVDCQRIYQRVIPSPDRTWRGSGTHAHGAGGGSGGSDDTLHLFLGQRNSQHALFRVSKHIGQECPVNDCFRCAKSSILVIKRPGIALHSFDDCSGFFRRIECLLQLVLP